MNTIYLRIITKHKAHTQTMKTSHYLSFYTREMMDGIELPHLLSYIHVCFCDMHLNSQGRLYCYNKI